MTILITGAASGIGNASALALAQRGYNVIACGRTWSALEPLENQANQLGLKLQYEQLDITEHSQRAKVSTWPVDVLINNAGVGESGPLIEIPLERLRRVWETNVIGTIALSQIVAKRLVAQRGGRIIIVGSTAGLITLPMLGPYTMTKYALEAAADALRMELKQFNIAVSLIEPGKIATGFNQKMTATKYTWLNSTSVYADQINRLKQSDQRFFQREYSVQAAVRGIIRAVAAPRPQARYVTPPQVSLSIRFAYMFPPRIRDWALRKM